MNELKQKWQQLEARERQLVSIMGAALGLALFYFAIWSPLHQGVADAELRLNSQQRNLTWMQRSAGQIIQAKGQHQSTGAQATGSLSQRVSRTASQHRISLSRIQPQKSDLSVRIDLVDFNVFLDWVRTMEAQGIIVVSLDITKDAAQGKAQVRKILLRLAS